MKLLLGSNSPRRKELLTALGFRFTVVSIDCDEIFPETLSVGDVAGYLSLLKSNAYSTLTTNEILITADTVVALNGKVLGKPKDKQEAQKMLRALSGNTHHVYTAFTVRTLDKTITETDVAAVTFGQISDADIDYYLEKYQPYDKAGSYGVQEWLGMTKITNIEGNFYTIMVLATHLIYTILKDGGRTIGLLEKH
jgi:septum formation protein